MTLVSTEKSTSLMCPNCQSTVAVPEGLRVTHCQNCDQHLYVSGERGIRRWQVHRDISRAEAEEKITGFFRGIDKAPDLKRTAVIKEVFLAYVPYWRVRAMVAGWRFGTVKRRRNKKTVHLPVEKEVF